MLLAAIGASSGGPGAEDYMAMLFRALVAVLVIALLIGGVWVFRQRLMKHDTDEESGTLSMGGLRDLVRQGKMTQEEFDQAKAAVVEATQKQIARAAARKAEAAEKARQPGGRRRAAGDRPHSFPIDDDVPPHAPN